MLACAEDEVVRGDDAEREDRGLDGGQDDQEEQDEDGRGHHQQTDGGLGTRPKTTAPPRLAAASLGHACHENFGRRRRGPQPDCRPKFWRRCWLRSERNPVYRTNPMVAACRPPSRTTVCCDRCCTSG